MSLTRPYPWEKSYPKGVRWDAPIETTTLGTLLDRAAASYGDRPAFEYRDHFISYRELAAVVDKAAAAFLALGLKRGDRLALYAKRSGDKSLEPAPLLAKLAAEGRGFASVGAAAGAAA